jgi:hypothetical protein
MRRFIGGWLIVQLCSLVSVPLVLCGAAQNLGAAAECTCSHDDGGMCPMHHTTKTSKSKSCSCRSSNDPLSGIVASLVGDAAILTAKTEIPWNLSASRLNAAVTALQDLYVVPDAPPPRA